MIKVGDVIEVLSIIKQMTNKMYIPQTFPYKRKNVSNS